ncbi:MAG: hypothetical protein LBD22_00330, partial [Spirochaetaceae bacterium]|nr:hypothetical protein [Spirochaetaceae bacterium]
MRFDDDCKIMIENDFKYYTENQEEIIKGHLGEYVAIKDAAVVDYYQTELAAFEAMKDAELGTFIV